ncbi:MAG: hypothetical protein OEN01_14945 [Candidatus Krumholzibacteria bacterium]|nr:hypothetical protein [Candidatus Krumholzibacteria bacterium]
MLPVPRFLIVPVLFSIVIGCAKDKAPTPPAVTVHFYALLDSLANDPSGTSVERLKAFLRKNEGYEIADTVQAELDRFRSSVTGQYHEARELARQGQFHLAESILKDLTEHFADTPDGEKATRYLEFEYDFGKAQWFLMHQRYEECETVARALLDRDLTAFQADQVETVLDNVGHVDAALSQSERASAKNACRQLSIVLEIQHGEEGRYPSSLSLSDMRRRGGAPLRGLSAIEGYKATKHGFSFVGVSAKGRHRIRVVNGQIQD